MSRITVRGHTLDPASPWGEAVLALDAAHMPNPWTRAQWEGLKAPHDLLFELREGRELLGFALYRLSPWEKLGHLLKLVVRPESRQGGTAATFWAEQEVALREMGIQKIFLEVGTDNGQAQSFYQRRGCVLLRRVVGFYSNGGDAWIMERQLGSSI